MTCRELRGRVVLLDCRGFLWRRVHGESMRLGFPVATFAFRVTVLVLVFQFVRVERIVLVPTGWRPQLAEDVESQYNGLS